MGSKHQHDLGKILSNLKDCTDKETAYKLLLKIRMECIGKSDDIYKLVELGKRFSLSELKTVSNV